MITQLDVTKISSMFENMDSDTSALVAESLSVVKEEDMDVVIFRAYTKLKVFVPKYMTEMETVKPKQTVAFSVDYSIFDNDPACRPSFSDNVIMEQNYIEVDDASVGVLDLAKMKKGQYLPASTQGNFYFIGNSLSKPRFSSGDNTIVFPNYDV